MSKQIINFRGDCGECTQQGHYNLVGASEGMGPGDMAVINGSSPENCIIGNDGAAVYAIELRQLGFGLYPYQVRFRARGPRGFGSGSFYLAFEDKDSDIYYISVYDPSKLWHTVSYNSDKPAIVRIYWSDYAFEVQAQGSRVKKAEYQIITPALEEDDAV